MPDELGGSLAPAWGTADHNLYWHVHNSFRFWRGYSSWKSAVIVADETLYFELGGG